MKKIIFIGAIHPPYNGVTIYNERILRSRIKALIILIGNRQDLHG